MLKMYRGQLFTIDLMVASVLAIAVLFLIVSVTMDVMARYAKNDEWLSLSVQGDGAMSQLMYGQSSPSDWVRYNYTTNVSAINIVKSRGVLDREKIEKLVASDYNETREKLGLGTSQLYITIRSFDGKTVVYSYGIQPTTISQKYYAERPALLDNVPVKVMIYVWRGE
ncbi:MAG: hypothetical protein ACPL0A_02690 [Candidatus Micrarchaeia archaeon]